MHRTIVRIVSLDTVTFKTKGNVGGWALWHEQILYSCGVYASLEDLPCAKDLADLCVAEKPKYRGRTSDVDPQDLIDLAWDGALAATMCGKIVRDVEPHQWKGQMPKRVVEARVRKRLSLDELVALALGLRVVRKSWHHNTIEAVGLGLWHLGRL